MSPPSRRALLYSLGVGLAAGLAGCETAPGTDSPTESATSSPTPTDTPTSSPTDTPTPTTEPLQCGPAPAPDAAWPVRDRSPAGDRNVDGWSGFGEAPSAAWTATATPPEDLSGRPRFSQPLVAGGGVYVAEAYVPGTMVEDPGGHQLQARDPATGEVEWVYEVPEVPASPAAWGDLVVVPSNETLYAVDRTGGTERWTHEFDGGAVSVVPAGDRAYVRVAGTDGTDDSVQGLTAEGEVAWTHSVDRELFSGPTVGPEYVHVGADDGTVFALDREDGTVAWTIETPQDERTSEFPPYVYSITVTDCGVYVVTDEDVEAYDDAGQFVWRAEGDFRELTTDGERVYGATIVGERGVVRAFDAVTGERRWQTPAEVDTYAPAAVTDGELYASSDEGLLALDPGDGQVLWRQEGAGDPATFADGTLYVTEGDPTEARLVALR